MERRVVITATSAITPIGDTEEKIFHNLENGVSGVSKMKEDGLLSPFLHCDVFGSVDYEIEYNFERKYRKTMGPVALSACTVAKNVIEASGIEQESLSSGRVGVSFGSIHGSPTVLREAYRKLFDGAEIGKALLNSTDYLKLMVHTAAANITRMFKITGRVIASCTACTTAGQAIGYGYEAVKYGLQDAMLCGAADEYDTTTVAVFDNLTACSIAYNDRPHLTPRPFDKQRDGLVVGEGAGAIMLEEYEYAKKRGAQILGEVIGFACGNNGGDLVLPNAQGVIQTIKMGLENARISPDEVDLISAHATATVMGDVVEAQAIYDQYGNKPLVTALKSFMGHTMSACGVIETILTLNMMRRGIVVPTLNLEEIDERCAMISHVTELMRKDINIASIQNFAFGGVNTSLFIKKWE